MGHWLRKHWQAVTVGGLFAASLVALCATATGVFLLPHQELEARDRLRRAAAELTSEAEMVVAELPADEASGRTLPDEFDRRLAEVTSTVLARYPGAEGGIYFGGGYDQFAGFAHPTGPEHPPGPGPKGNAHRRDPPPLETASIRQQAREALTGSQSDLPLVEVRDVGPSRVAVATVALGEGRPARAAAWVMVRLVDPASQRDQLRGYLLSAALALGGMAVAVALTVRLGRSLRREREHRERLAGELQQAERLASIGRLLAGVAHEVRSPLAAIRSTVQLWERLPDQARTPASLTAVVAAVDRINALVGRLLYFARSGHEARRPVDLAAAVSDTLELTLAQADAQGVTFATDFAPVPAVWAAPQAIGQVLLNLVQNALQAMPTGGRLVCRVRPGDDGTAEVVLSDTGPGLPAEVRDTLFEPFVTSRPDGTGLGLALCREIVTQHGGTIRFDPDVSVGATVRLTLPLARPE